MGNTARVKGELDQRAMPQVLPIRLGSAYFLGQVAGWYKFMGKILPLVKALAGKF